MITPGYQNPNPRRGIREFFNPTIAPTFFSDLRAFALLISPIVALVAIMRIWG